MPRKHPRPDAHVERLAALFRTRWVPADGIAPWLRKNLPRLRRIVDDEGWSWDDLGRALTLAGITYAGWAMMKAARGRPWAVPGRWQESRAREAGRGRARSSP